MQLFQEVIDMENPDLFKWLTGQEPIPAEVCTLGWYGQGEGRISLRIAPTPCPQSGQPKPICINPIPSLQIENKILHQLCNDQRHNIVRLPRLALRAMVPAICANHGMAYALVCAVLCVKLAHHTPPHPTTSQPTLSHTIPYRTPRQPSLARAALKAKSGSDVFSLDPTAKG